MIEDVGDIRERVRAKLEKFCTELDKAYPPVSCLPLKPVRVEKTTVFDSKLGGTPYLPKDMEYPTVREGEYVGKPLRLLAQLNFGRLLKIEGFPDRGILQFFAGCDGDYVYGMDSDDQFDQNCFRVIYHESVIEDESRLISDEDMPRFNDGEEYDYVFEGEFLLQAGEPARQALSACDYRFDKIAPDVYNKAFGTNVKAVVGSEGISSDDKAFFHALFSAEYSTGTHIGGFPYFTQYDPREYKEECAKADILLFQLDSGGDGDDEIMWGDCGVGNFFISREDLAKRDFSHVLYNWDCG